MRNSYVPPATDEFGQHAVALIRRGMTVGYAQAIVEEVNRPTWDDPDWCKMIAGMVSGGPNVLQSERLYRCHKCSDLGLIFLPDEMRGGEPHSVVRPCDPCAFKIHLKAEWFKKQEREGTRRRGRMDDEFSGG